VDAEKDDTGGEDESEGEVEDNPEADAVDRVIRRLLDSDVSMIVDS
jgi:hypothetical protein